MSSAGLGNHRFWGTRAAELHLHTNVGDAGMTWESRAGGVEANENDGHLYAMPMLNLNPKRLNSHPPA